jgi:hypothetical protein
MKEPLLSVRKKTYRLPIGLVKRMAEHSIEFDEDETDIVTKALEEYLDPAREAQRKAEKEAEKARLRS